MSTIDEDTNVIAIYQTLDSNEKVISYGKVIARLI